MKTIKLFLKMSFTSLSPDAQPISLGIVSEEGRISLPWYKLALEHGRMTLGEFIKKELKADVDGIVNNGPRSFYAEFSDFDINRCDDWVKDNVISKLKSKDKNYSDGINHEVYSDTETIKRYLKGWLEQFRDYDIQFVTDCGWFNWYWMVQLLAEWDTTAFESSDAATRSNHRNYKIGLPKLPSNISPVPEDLNDLIARTKGISVREAFDLNREKLAFGSITLIDTDGHYEKKESISHGDKYNTLFDAKVIKTIYIKFKKQ